MDADKIRHQHATNKVAKTFRQIIIFIGGRQFYPATPRLYILDIPHLDVGVAIVFPDKNCFH